MKSVEELRAELTTLAEQGPPAKRDQPITKKGLMRELYPEICKLLEAGWRGRDVVKWLAARNVKMSDGMFRVYLFELDQERGHTRLKGLDSLKPTPKAQAPAAAAVNPAGAASQTAAPPAVKAKPLAASERPLQTETPSQDDLPASESSSDSDPDYSALLSTMSQPELDEKGFVKMPSAKCEK